MKANMIKVVFNGCYGCYGGFGLSHKATERLAQLGVTSASASEALADFVKDTSIFNFDYSPFQDELSRHDPRLAQVVEELGIEANGNFANLQIAELEGKLYRIDEYDGMESVENPSSMEWIDGS